MRSKFLLIALGSALAGCNTMPDAPSKGVAAVNVPVVTSTDYVFDAAAPGGALAPGEGQRLDGWFQGLGLGYGDTVYVDGASPETRSQVAAIAGRYGMLVTPGGARHRRHGPAQLRSGCRRTPPRGRAELPELEQVVPARLE